MLLHAALVSLFLIVATDATSTSHVSISFGDTDISYMHDHAVPAYHPAPYHPQPLYHGPPVYHPEPAHYIEPVYKPEPAYRPEPAYKPEPEEVEEPEPAYKPEPEEIEEPEVVEIEEPEPVIYEPKTEIVKPKPPVEAPKPTIKPKPTHKPKSKPVYAPHPYQPEPYQPEPYQPEPYQPEPYHPEPYHPEPQYHPKPSYKHHNEVPACAERTNNTWCIEDGEYPEYDIKHAIQYHLDIFNGFYADVADLNTVLSVERPNTLDEETYLCPSETSYIKPLRALNTEGKWRIVINDVNIHYKTLTQNARVEQCLSGGDSCPKVPMCYDSKCLQKSIYVRFLIYDPYDQYFPFAIETFKLPASCACLLGAYTITH